MKSFFKKVFSCFVDKSETQGKKTKKKKSLETALNEIIPFLGHVKFTKFNSIRYIIPASWMKDILKVKTKGLMYATSLPVLDNEQFKQKNSEDCLKENINPIDICLIIHEFMVEINKLFEVNWIIHVSLMKNNQIDLSKAVVLKKANFEQFEPKQESETEIEEVFMLSREFTLVGIGVGVSRQNSNMKHSSKQTANPSKNISQIQNNDVSLKFSQHDKENGEQNIKDSDTDKDKIHILNVEQPLNRVNINRNNITNTNTKITTKKYNTNSTNDKTIMSPQSSSNIIHSTGVKSLKPNIFNIVLTDYQSVQLKPKGLSNPSVYCFMNSCLQCLCSIPELNYYFMNQLYKNEKRSKKRPDACNAFCDFLTNYNNAKVKLRPPESIYDTCHNFLECNRQHDCQEFLRRLLGRMQEELNYNKKYIFPDNITQGKAWIMYREVNPSFIDSIFTGLMRSTVKCCKCGYASYTYDPFLDLSLSIDRKSKESLKNCLNTYFQEEKIDCEYKCSNCKKKTSIKKKLDIALHPPILTIQFKRFGENSRKINTSIVFESSLYFKIKTNEDAMSSKTSYELIAVAVHMGGSICSGHYIAYTNRNDSWYCCNDGNVSECSEEDALSPNAYLLFYRQK